MGACFGAGHNKYHKGDSDGMKLKVKRLRLYIGQQMQKQTKECLRIQKILLEQFQKQSFNRSMPAQESLINQIVEGVNRNHCFTVVRHQLDKIVDYSHHMNNIQKARQTLYPSFSIILYSDTILKDMQVSFQCYQINKRFPQVKQASDQLIDSQIMRHHKKTKEPTLHMKNQYILKLCNQENIKLDNISIVGHPYKYGL